MPDSHPDAWVKRPHAKNCNGSVFNRHEIVCVDRAGRLGNGGIVAHVFTCTHSWAGCKARVLVAERVVRGIAARAIGENDDD